MIALLISIESIIIFKHINDAFLLKNQSFYSLLFSIYAETRLIKFLPNE